MARNRERPEQQDKDPNYGAGGTYVIGEDGVRRLVERTENPVIRTVDEANQPAREIERS